MDWFLYVIGLRHERVKSSYTGVTIMGNSIEQNRNNTNF